MTITSGVRQVSLPEDLFMTIYSLYLVWGKCHYLIPEESHGGITSIPTSVAEEMPLAYWGHFVSNLIP
jgi:hypothetical protein